MLPYAHPAYITMTIASLPPLANQLLARACAPHIPSLPDTLAVGLHARLDSQLACHDIPPKLAHLSMLFILQLAPLSAK